MNDDPSMRMRLAEIAYRACRAVCWIAIITVAAWVTNLPAFVSWLIFGNMTDDEYTRSNLERALTIEHAFDVFVRIYAQILAAMYYGTALLFVTFIAVVIGGYPVTRFIRSIRDRS